MNLVVLCSANLIIKYFFNFKTIVDSWIALFILFFSQIVILQLILGIINKLTLANVIVFNLLLLFLIILIIKKFELTPKSNLYLDLNSLKPKNLELFCLAVILGFALVKISINLVNPPFGWDNLNYHFSFPVEWLKQGNLDNPITISDDPSPSYYPINGSLYFLWLILPLKNVFLADLGQIPFFILAFLAIYSLGIKLNLSKENAYFASCLFTLIPNYFKQMEIAYVDVMVVALFLVCLNYLFLLEEEFSLKYILIYSISLGLFLGTKTIALSYGILLLIPFVYLCFKNNKSYALILLFLIVIILGGFTYIRNFLETRNPLYPLDFSLFGKTIFKGVMDLNTYRAHFKPTDYRLSKLLLHEGLGAQSIIFILPAIFLALPVTLIKKRRNLNFNLVFFLILPFLIYLVYRYIIPLANIRYLYPLLGIGIIIGFYFLLKLLNVPWVVIKTLVVICVLTSICELAGHLELIVSIILAVLLFFLVPILIKNIQAKEWIRKPLFISILIIFLIIVLLFLEKDYIKNEYPRYIKMQRYSGFWPDAICAWDWLNKNTQGNNIAYVGRPVPFPLYGGNFKNNVYYVSVNKTDPIKLHYFQNSYYHWGYDFLSLHKNLEAEGNYRSKGDYTAWLTNLLRRNTDYLFIYSLHEIKKTIFPLEDDWAKKNPDKFIPVFTNETIHIYKIIN